MKERWRFFLTTPPGHVVQALDQTGHYLALYALTWLARGNPLVGDNPLADSILLVVQFITLAFVCVFLVFVGIFLLQCLVLLVVSPRHLLRPYEEMARLTDPEGAPS